MGAFVGAFVSADCWRDVVGGAEGITRPNISPATIQECFVGSEVIISVSDTSMHSVVWIDALICTYVFQPFSCCCKCSDVYVILF